MIHTECCAHPERVPLLGFGQRIWEKQQEDVCPENVVVVSHDFHPCVKPRVDDP